MVASPGALRRGAASWQWSAAMVASAGVSPGALLLASGIIKFLPDIIKFLTNLADNRRQQQARRRR
jgi:hypothetical protein